MNLIIFSFELKGINEDLFVNFVQQLKQLD